MSAGDKEVDRDDVVSFGGVHLEGKTRGYEFVLQELCCCSYPIEIFLQKKKTTFRSGSVSLWRFLANSPVQEGIVLVGAKNY